MIITRVLRVFDGRQLNKLFILKSRLQIVSSQKLGVFNYHLTGCRYFGTFPPEIRQILCRLTHNTSGNNTQSSQTKSRKCKSKLANAADIFREKSDDIDIDAIKIFFPEPRVTMNILASRLPHKLFDVYYKHNSPAPRVGKKKGKELIKNDWTCSYVLQWPEQKIFESTATSKKQAAEAAATSAVVWLCSIGHVDSSGQPVLERLKELKEKANERLEVAVSEQSERRLKKILAVYEQDIREIFRLTHEAAVEREQSDSVTVSDDAAMEDEDELTQEELYVQNQELNCELQNRVHPVYGRVVHPPSEQALSSHDERLRRILREYDKNRTPLPIDEYTSALTAALAASRAVIVCGAPGCGKSTRAPLAALRDVRDATALVAQPRRVAARALAARVADELGERVGETVGYQVRLDARPPRPPGGSVLYCTSGVLLRRLQTNPGLEGCTHVYVDEAHTRDLNTDLSLLLLRRALRLNRDLRLVIMSATLDTGLFARYFDNCPVLEIPGRTHPVEEIYLEDFPSQLGDLRLPRTLEASAAEAAKPAINCKEIADTIQAIDAREAEGTILVFLPGWAEIQAVGAILRDKLGNSGRHHVLPVHSRLSLLEQAKIFTTTVPGARRVVLATNIAETSITVPDATCALDVGAHRESRPRRGTSSLQLAWVSQAAAKQRAGRAGRVRPGRCYKMYTREKEQSFIPHAVPEILRVPLDKLVLDCKSYAPEEEVEDFLSQLLEPPDPRAVERAVSDLVEIGALSARGRLTALGRAAGALPLPPQLACALLRAAALRVAPALAAAAQHGAEPFDAAAERREEIRSTKARYHPTSDHLALRWIQEEFDQLTPSEQEQFCEELGLRKDAMLATGALSALHLAQLSRCGALGRPAHRPTLTKAEEDALTVAALLSGADLLLQSRWYLKTEGKIRRKKGLFTSSGERAHVASESVNHDVCSRSDRTELLAYIDGTHSPERRALVTRRTSALPPCAALLFCRAAECVGAQKDDEGNEWSAIELPRHRLTIFVPTRQVDMLMATRNVIWEMFQYFVERDCSEEDEMVEKFRDELVSSVAKMLVEAKNEMSSQIVKR